MKMVMDKEQVCFYISKETKKRLDSFMTDLYGKPNKWGALSYEIEQAIIAHISKEHERLRPS